MPPVSPQKEAHPQEAAVIFGIAVFGWAFPGVFVRLMPHLPSLPLVGLRLGMAWLALTPFVLLSSSRVGVIAATKNWRCALLSLDMLFYYLAATSAFLYAPVGEVALVIASAPLFAVMLRWLGRKPVARLEFLGACLAITGVLIMAAPTLGSTGHSYPLQWFGILLSVSAAVAAAAFAIGNRHVMQLGQSPGAIVQVWLTFTFGLLLLPSLLTVSHSTFAQPSMLWLVPLGAFSTAMPTVAVAASSHRLPPVAATMINPLTSVCATIVAVIVLHETPTVWMAFGGSLVLAAVFTASSTRPTIASDLVGE